jgi:hypothetical protein
MALTKVIKFVAKTIGFMLQSYASCEKWEDDVESNKDTTKQMKAFEQGSTVTTLMGTVSKRLGFSKTLDLGMYVLHLEFSHTAKNLHESRNCIGFKWPFSQQCYN